MEQVKIRMIPGKINKRDWLESEKMKTPNIIGEIGCGQELGCRQYFENVNKDSGIIPCSGYIVEKKVDDRLCLYGKAISGYDTEIQCKPATSLSLQYHLSEKHVTSIGNNLYQLCLSLEEKL